MECFTCGLPDVPMTVIEKLNTGTCPRCGSRIFASPDEPSITFHTQTIVRRSVLNNTEKLRQQVSEQQARIKALETGISLLIDSCDCQWKPGPNSCSRCRTLIKLLEGD